MRLEMPDRMTDIIDAPNHGHSSYSFSSTGAASVADTPNAIAYSDATGD